MAFVNFRNIGLLVSIGVLGACATTNPQQLAADQEAALSEQDEKAKAREKRKEDFRAGKRTLTPDEFYSLNVDPGDAGGGLDDFDSDD